MIFLCLLPVLPKLKIFYSMGKNSNRQKTNNSPTKQTKNQTKTPTPRIMRCMESWLKINSMMACDICLETRDTPKYVSHSVH